jgi:tetratricopeptide (TPR) repeat protein
VKLAEIQRAANHIAAGDALLRQGNADGAIREYQQSLRITGSPGVRAKIGNALATGGQMNEGLAQYRLALANTPLPDTNIALNMALLLARMRQYDEAITLYRVGMRLPIAPNRLTGALGGTPLTPGYAAYQRALSREASTYSIFDITFSPSAFDMPLFEAAVCTALGKKRYGWPDALEQFDQAIRLSPNFAPAYLYRGDALELRGNRAEARTMYERARALGTGEVARRAQEALNRVNRRR